MNGIKSQNGNIKSQNGNIKSQNGNIKSQNGKITIQNLLYDLRIIIDSFIFCPKLEMMSKKEIAR